MIRLTQKLDAPPGTLHATLTLPLEKRMKSRLRVTLDDGTEAGLFLERGVTLRDGDCLASLEGFAVLIKAAAERVSTLRTPDPLLLARASYHLGNRHVPLQIGAGFVRYQHDLVLDDLARRLGLSVTVEEAAFQPEPGAYLDHGQHRH
jgi:urease accessory protein